jgi:hypothetical protein
MLRVIAPEWVNLSRPFMGVWVREKVYSFAFLHAPSRHGHVLLRAPNPAKPKQANDIPALRPLAMGHMYHWVRGRQAAKEQIICGAAKALP